MSNRQLLLTFAAVSTSVMEVLDMTIVNVALPDIQGALSASPDEISWILSSYLIATAIFMPLTGFLSQRLGNKFYFLTCIAGFTISSVMCGMATNIDFMVFGRLLQGAFGAGLIPLSQAIMVQAYSEEERGKAMTIWTMGIVIGPIIGPTIGGVIIEYLSWRWIFYINLPVGLIAASVSYFVLQETEKVARFFDIIGIILLGIGLGSLQFTLDRGNGDDWYESKIIWLFSILAIVGLICFIYYSKMISKQAIFSLRIFNDRNYTLSSVIMFLFSAGMLGSLVLQPIMMGFIFNYTALQIGLVMAPRALAGFVCMMFVHKIIHRIATKHMILTGFFLNAISCYMAASTFNQYISWQIMILPFIVQGFGIGLIFAPLVTQSLITLPKQYLHDATGVYNLMRVLGGGFGIAACVTYYTRSLQKCWQEQGAFINQYNKNVDLYFNNFSINPEDQAQIMAVELIKNSQMQAIINSFYLLAVFFLCILPLVLFLDKKKSAAELDSEIAESLS